MATLQVRGSILSLAALACAGLACAGPGPETADPSGLNREGMALVGQQRHPAALAKFEAALEACEPVLGSPACPDLATILSNLGSLYYLTGEYRTAEPFLVRAVKMAPVCEACPSAAMDATLHSLAAVYWAEGRAAESVPIYERALSLGTDRRGPSDISLLPY